MVGDEFHNWMAGLFRGYVRRRVQQYVSQRCKMKKKTYQRTYHKSGPSAKNSSGPNVQDPIWVACLVWTTAKSVFVKYYTEIILYILYRTFSTRPWCCAIGQTVGSQNIVYYGIPGFAAKKHITSSTCRHGLERSRVKSSPTNIPLYLWYVLCEYSTEGT